MEQKQNMNRLDDEVRAYNILLHRHTNDDRLLGERSSAFLTSSSILFLGFLMILQFFPTSRIVCIIIPLLGFALCFLAFCSIGRTSRGLDFWEKQEEELEGKACSFAYMKEKGMLPHRVYEAVEEARIGRLKIGRLFKTMRNRKIYTYYVPAIFFFLWAASLIWVLSLN